jgi:broad specificity phosphatase PhoE
MTARFPPGEFTARWQQTPPAQRPFVRWADGCETWLEFSARVQQTLNRVLETYAGKTLVVVSHGEYIQASFVYFFRLSASAMPGVSLENASLTHWFRSEQAQKWILERCNDAQHGERRVVA